jgi:hypothetical protein
MSQSKNTVPAKTLKKYLAAKGFSVPHTVCLEAIARIGGYQNRHHEANAHHNSVKLDPKKTNSKITIWAVAYEHEYGTDAFATATEAEAKIKLRKICEDWWEDRSDKSAPESTDGMTDDAVIEAYFEDHPLETYRINPVELPILTITQSHETKTKLWVLRINNRPSTVHRSQDEVTNTLRQCCIDNWSFRENLDEVRPPSELTYEELLEAYFDYGNGQAGTYTIDEVELN